MTRSWLGRLLATYGIVVAGGVLGLACSKSSALTSGGTGGGAGGPGGAGGASAGAAGATDGGAGAAGGMGTGAHARSIGSGDMHSCAVIDDGTVRCWGMNRSGQLGTDDMFPPSPQQVPGIVDAVAVAGGSSHTCALRSGGTVSCWGDNHSGQLGDGSNISRSSPAPVSDLTNVVEIAAGGAFSCALLSDKTIRCWGANDHGQLGSGVGSGRLVPAMASVPAARRIVAGLYGGCAIADADGTVWCWGDYGSVATALDGGSGGGSADAGTRRGFPAAVAPSAKDVARASTYGGDETACALLLDGTVTCWSIPSSPSAGCGPTDAAAPCFTPQADGLVQISMGGAAMLGGHGCGITADGHVGCWGTNLYGELGSPGDSQLSFGTITVPDVNGATMISSGAAHSCALVQDGSVWCWGRSAEGQLGGLTLSGPAPGPHRVPL